MERKLTLSAVIAISIAGMLGGIFVLPGIAAGQTGESIWLAFLIAAICIFPAVLSKSELATAMPSSGGSYVYIERAFGPIFGTISGIGLWLSLLFKSAFCLIGFGAYLLVLVNIPEVYIKYIALGFLVLIMAINIFGVKKVGKVQLVIVILSLLGLISILFLNLPISQKQASASFLTDGTGGLIGAIAFVYISYAGVTKIAAIAGEVKDPKKNIPLGMIASLIIIAIVYIAVSYVLVNNVPLNELKEDVRPIHTLSLALGGKWFGYVIAGIGVITLISMANSGVLACSRFPFAMAMDKLLPSQMAKVHKTYLTPINTILLTCLVMALVIWFLPVEKIAKLASAFKVMMFIAVNLCVIILRETAVQWYRPTFKSPLYPFVQIFGIISGIILLFYLGWQPFIAILFIGIIGFGIYYFFGNQANRSGVLRNYTHKPASFLFFKKEIQQSEGKKEFDIPEDWLDGEISKDAGVIVPLLGNEYSPESLVEIAASLNQKEGIQVVNITEVPDQTVLDAVLKETPKIKSIERKLLTVSEIKKENIDFESIATHNISETMRVLSTYSNSDWLVLGWDGKAYNGILINNPVGWIVSNIDSNFALFKDNGVRYIRNVVLAVRHNSKDIEQLIETTDHLCKYKKATFTLLHVLNDNISLEKENQIKRHSESLLSNHSSIGKLRIEKSSINPIEVVENISAEFDLLILGTPRKDTWITMLFGTGKDKIASSSICSVLRLTIKD